MPVNKRGDFVVNEKSINVKPIKILDRNSSLNSSKNSKFNSSKLKARVAGGGGQYKRGLEARVDFYPQKNVTNSGVTYK